MRYPHADGQVLKAGDQEPALPTYQQATKVRVDTDVLLWLKGQGKGYQTRINVILRESMLRALHPKG